MFTVNEAKAAGLYFVGLGPAERDNDIFKARGVSKSEKLVALYYAHLCSADQSHSWPSFPEVAKAIGCHPDTVKRCCKSLLEKKLFADLGWARHDAVKIKKNRAYPVRTHKYLLVWPAWEALAVSRTPPNLGCTVHGDPAISFPSQNDEVEAGFQASREPLAGLRPSSAHLSLENLEHDSNSNQWDCDEYLNSVNSTQPDSAASQPEAFQASSDQPEFHDSKESKQEKAVILGNNQEPQMILKFPEVTPKQEQALWGRIKEYQEKRPNPLTRPKSLADLERDMRAARLKPTTIPPAKPRKIG